MTDASKKQPTDDYEVGYCRPPKQHQWKKGHSGNSKGRKKPPSDIAQCTAKALEQTIKVQHGGRIRRISVADAIAQRLVQKAAMGDRQSFREVARLQQEYFGRGQTENGWVIIDARPTFDNEEGIQQRLMRENQELQEENQRLKAAAGTPPLQLPSPNWGQEQP